MKLRSIHPGGTVTCNVRGRTFKATVLQVDHRTSMVRVDPPRGITYHTVSARDVRAYEPAWHPVRDTQIRKDT